jgi:hypothetical protein
MNIFKKIYNYFFPLLTIEERIELYCEYLNKDISYGKGLTMDHLDKVKFKKRVFVLKKK